MQIDIAEDLLAAFEWVEEGKPYREWLVPADVLNDAGAVKLLRLRGVDASELALPVSAGGFFMWVVLRCPRDEDSAALCYARPRG